MYPKISILTISLNRKLTIQSSINSLLSQDYNNIEYIIIDGGSTDGTIDIISKYSEKIDHFISEKDTGMYNALNKAIKLATGDIIGILHSDDVFFNSNILSTYAEFFEKTNADLVYANGLYINNIDSIESNSKINRIYKSSKFKPWYLYFGWIPLHTTIFVKREIFDKYGLYDESFSIASDYEISLRWFTNTAINKHFLNTCTVKMLMGGKSTNITLQKKKSAEDYRILKQYMLWGKVTLFFKIVRKIPQYLLPHIFNYKYGN